MNINDLDLTKEIQKLIETRDDFREVDDCYCALMKQIFLSKSTLN